VSRKRPDGFSKKARALFLEHFARTGRVQASADVACVHRITVWQTRKDDPEFAALYDDAAARYCDILEAEAHRRAVEGVEEPVFHQGAECGYVRKYSDRLLELQLKGRLPERYRDRVSADVKVEGGVLVVGAPQSEADFEGAFGSLVSPRADVDDGKDGAE
jgi:hypothetical protein